MLKCTNEANLVVIRQNAVGPARLWARPPVTSSYSLPLRSTEYGDFILFQATLQHGYFPLVMRE